jgi:peptide methionine sulfoxide reductase msrA/msrB
MKTLILLPLTLFLLLPGSFQQCSLRLQPAEAADIREAVFAGGCFWCTEADFEKVPGVIEAISGYTGGSEVNPTYAQVSAGETGHVEAVRVSYDPARVGYAQLVEWFWRNVDPTDGAGQFSDRGSQYRSLIFFADPEQQRIAALAKQKLAASGRFNGPIRTEILPLGPFYPAEADHQNYYRENPMRYKWYRSGSGRDAFLERFWSDDELKFDSVKAKTLEKAGSAENLKLFQ